MTEDTPEQFFRRMFAALSGIRSGAYHWQEELFVRFIHGDWPSDLCLPTGLGKTSVMYVWLLALAWQALHPTKTRSVPMRLIWVVDRRVVVDQATEEAGHIVSMLRDEPACAELRQAFSILAVTTGSDDVLAVSTLRGEFADNRKWSRDPSRPAIIVGTVDMVGSRLLFSGYGDSRRRRALHAGLLGQDVLIVNDEAHLTVAFAGLLDGLRRFAGTRRPFVTMRLSATPRGNQLAAFPETLDHDLDNPQFRKCYCAVKRLHLLKVDDAKKEIHRLAMERDRRTLVFVRSPEEARKIAAAIHNRNSGANVPVITGTQRGFERDQLREDPIVQRYFQKEGELNADPCWMVATSAGEVGINFSADRLITDLDTADHLLQRFGRLNRFGETEGDAYVVFSPKQIGGEAGAALGVTLEYLQALPDVSPKTLRSHPPPSEALPLGPHLAPLLPWHVDVWSMTSLSAVDWPSRPTVDAWLRGDDEEAVPPETYVAWRDDVDDLSKPGVAASDLEDVFDCYPVIAQERLKQYTPGLREALGSPRYQAIRAILIGADGEIHPGTLGDLVRDRRSFEYGTLILPPGTGHLDRYGMVDWEAKGEPSPEEHRRYDVSHKDGRERVRVEADQPDPDLPFRQRCSVEIPTDDETDGPRWVYFTGKLVPRERQQQEELLEIHQEQVAGLAAELARRLLFDERKVRVFEWAGKWHDSGKRRGLWQRAAGNLDATRFLAKSRRLNGRILGGYRHELGSLLDAESHLPPDFTGEERDLGLHLIAAHHGWGRPHFSQQSFDKEGYRHSEGMALASARRFGRLQARYGAWGLAYLEVIFRSADAIVSAQGLELPSNG